MFNRNQIMGYALSVAIVAAMSGCAVGPDFQAPGSPLDQAQLQVRLPDSSSAYGKLSQTAVPNDWWTVFNDSVLSALVDQAVHDNLDIEIAWARLAQARAQAGIDQAGRYPQLDQTGDFFKQANSENGPLHALGAPTAPYNLWHVGIDAAWEIDLWGRQRRISEGSLARLEASTYDREAVQVALVAEVARTYLVLRGTQERLAIAQKNLQIAKESLRLVQSRQRNGVATRFDLASAQAQVNEVEALIPSLESQQGILMNALAFIVGAAPRTLDITLEPSQTPLKAPATVAVGISSELAKRRPDILSAQARLHAATASIGAAKADFYPRITLVGTFGFESFDDENLASWNARRFSFGPSLYLPIFQGGRLQRTLELTQARQQEAAIDYRRTVLRAWHEIDNAINTRSEEERRRRSLEDAYGRSEQALDAAKQAYQNGVADYTTMLVAQRTLLASQLALSDSTTASAVSIVALYKAVGGGWDPRKVLSDSTSSIASNAQTQEAL